MRRTAALLANSIVLFGLSLALPQAADATSPQTGLNSAAAYAHSNGYSTGIAVLDTSTGRFYGSGSYNSSYASESVAKVFVATEILLQGRMHGSTASIAYKMITQSDDNSMNRLYGGAGGDGVINRIERHYHINIGSPPIRSGWWGNTHITAKGMVYFYRAIKRDRRVSDWLRNAMHHSTTYGSDGTYQHFGIPSATSGYGVKQGWGADDNCFCHATWNSTGFVNSDRYTVAILTAGPGRSYNSPISHMLTSEARRVLPSGKIDDPAAHNPRSAMDYVGTSGDIVHLVGYAIDPDHPATQMTIALYEGSHRIAVTKTNVYSAWVNRTFHGAGDHRYRFVFNARNGRHTYCAVAYNLGAGTVNPKNCRTLAVDGAPRGYLDSATASVQTVQLKGWAWDHSAPTSTSTDVQVYDGSRSLGVFRANTSRPDVDRYFHIAGTHGFVISLPLQAPGSHSYRIYALNRGYPNPNVQVSHSPRTVQVFPIAVPTPPTSQTH